MSHQAGRLARRLSSLLAVLLVLEVLPTGAATSAAQHAKAAPLIDLAGVTASPADLEDAGYGAGFGYSGSSFYAAGHRTTQVLTEFIGQAYGRSAEPIADARARQGLTTSLWRPTEPGEREIADQVTVLLAEFEERAGAQLLYDYYEDASVRWRNWVALDLIEELADLGEQAVGWTATDEPDGPDGEVPRRLAVMVQDGAWLLVVVAQDNGGADPEVAAAERLLATLLDRLDDAEAGDGETPGLASLVQRLDEIPIAEGNNSLYLRRDGVDFGWYSEDPEDADALQAVLGEAIDVYLYDQLVQDQPANWLVYGARVLRFPSERAAARWLDDVEDALAAVNRVSDLERLPDGPELGDESRAFRNHREGLDGVEFVDERVYARLGAYGLAMILADDQPLPDELLTDVVEEVGPLQVACVEDDGCTEPPVMPAALVDGLEALGLDGDAYVSPDYGWSLTWDGDLWSLNDVGSSRGTDWLGLRDPEGNPVGFVAHQAYDGDVDTCLTEMAEVLDEPFDDVEEIRRSPADTEATAAIYRGTFEGDAWWTYLGCRALPDQAVLETWFYSQVLGGDRHFTLLQDLLSGLELPNA